MEEHGEAGLGNDLVQRVEGAVVRKERLDVGVELDSTAPGLLGSTDANGMSTSGFAAATSAISSFGTARRPVIVSASTVKMTAAICRSR
jgi:hypothetical protein